jgi:hypothetical protein
VPFADPDAFADSYADRNSDTIANPDADCVTNSEPDGYANANAYTTAKSPFERWEYGNVALSDTDIRSGRPYDRR